LNEKKTRMYYQWNELLNCYLLIIDKLTKLKSF